MRLHSNANVGNEPSNGAVYVIEEADLRIVLVEERLDRTLEESFPASDPLSSMRFS